MKFFNPFVILFFFCCSIVIGQEKDASKYAVDASYFYGTILRHNKDIGHLITGHPEGITISYNRKTFGEERWERAYNFPDVGLSFIYHNGKDERLGDVYGVFGHYDFFLLKRKLILRIGQGIAVATNPFDLESNFKNIAYGSRLLPATYFQLKYNVNVTKNWSALAGMQFMHFSNGNAKAPNTSTNTIAFNVGLSYTTTPYDTHKYVTNVQEEAITDKKVKLDFLLSGGLNESDFVGLGQHPFFVVSAIAHKRLSYLSTLQFGVDYFHATSLKKEIEFLTVAFPGRVAPDTDYKRVGLFAGYKHKVNKMSVVAQAGYYIYYPYDFEGRFYQRVGLTYDISDTFYGQVAIKTHGAKAEAIEFGLGIKL